MSAEESARLIVAWQVVRLVSRSVVDMTDAQALRHVARLLADRIVVAQTETPSS